MAKNIPPALAFLAPPPDSCAPDDVGGSVPSLVLPLDRSWSWSSASLDQEDDSPSAIDFPNIGSEEEEDCVPFSRGEREAKALNSQVEKIVLPVKEGGNTSGSVAWGGGGRSALKGLRRRACSRGGE